MKKRRWLQGLAGLMVGSGCLWLSLRGVDVGQATIGIREASWFWVGVALVGTIMVSAGKALRWQWLYPRSALPLCWTSHFSILLVAQMLNIVVPVRLGEIARMGLMQQEQRPFGMTLGTIAVEKSLDMTATGLLLLLAVPAAILPEWLHPATEPGFIFTGGALLVLLVLLGVCRRQLLGWLVALPRPRRRSWAHWVDRLVDLVETTLRGIGGVEKGRLLAVVGLTGLIWLLSVAVIRLVFVAFGIELGWIVALTLMLVIIFSNLAPTPPALIGLVGMVAEAVLSPLGVPRSQALALGMVLNVVLVGPPVILGSWFAVMRLLRLLTAPDPEGGVRQALGLARVNPPTDKE